MTRRFIWLGPLGTSSFVADATVNAGANMLIAALGMVSGVLAARLLGPRGRGELAAIQTWPCFVAGLAMLGMPEAIAYYSAREPSEAGSYLGSAVVVALISSAPFMAAGYALVPLMLHAQTPATVWAGRWYLLIVPLYALMGLPRHPLQGRRDFVPWNAMRIAPNVAWIGVLVLSWTCARAYPTFVAAGNLIALATLVFPFAALVACRMPGPFRPDLSKWPSLLAYGLPCMLTMVPQTLNARLDQMLMAALLAPHELGLYVVAVAWSGAIMPLLTALAAVTMPAVAGVGDEEQRIPRFATAVRATAALALLLAIALAAITPLSVAFLFGPGFKAAVPAALVLVPAAAVLGFNSVLQEGLRGLGRPYDVLEAELSGLGVTIVSLAVMLGPMGIMGAAISSLSGYSTVTAVLLLNARRHAGTTPKELLFLTSGELERAFATAIALAQKVVPSTE